MSSGPEQHPSQPFGGAEYPALEGSPPLDYPDSPDPSWQQGDAGLPPPLYPPPHPPPPYPGPMPYWGHPGPPGYPLGYPYPADPYDPYRPMRPPGTNGKAIAALVTSLVGLLFCGLPSIAGLILGFIAIRETRQTGQDGYGMALAGAIIGGLAVAFWVLYFAVVMLIAVSGFQYAP